MQDNQKKRSSRAEEFDKVDVDTVFQVGKITA